jgi:hypothetical protein
MDNCIRPATRVKYVRPGLSGMKGFPVNLYSEKIITGNIQGGQTGNIPVIRKDINRIIPPEIVKYLCGQVLPGLVKKNADQGNTCSILQKLQYPAHCHSKSNPVSISGSILLVIDGGPGG